MIVALVIAVLVSNRTIRERDWEIRKIQFENIFLAQDVAALRHKLGSIDAQDPLRYYITRFKDQYSVDSELRYGIHVPDASKCSIWFFAGVLPKAGLPDKRQAITPGEFASGEANLALILENRKDLKGTNELRIGLYRDLRLISFSAQPLPELGIINWDFWLSDSRDYGASPFGLVPVPISKVESFVLEEPFVILKRFGKNPKGEQVGFMFWIEESAQKKLNPNR